MSSNFSNYFSKAYDSSPHFDELVYGFNGTSGSQRMDGSKQAVGYVDYDDVSLVIIRSTINGRGFSITGSYDGTSIFQKSEVKIDVDAAFVDGAVEVSSSNEVWLRLNTTSPPVGIGKNLLMFYLANTINTHRLAGGPPIIASSSGSTLILTQEYPGSAGNECKVQNLPGVPKALPGAFEFQNFAGGDGIGDGPYSISWAPVTGTSVATGVSIVSSYILSPVRHGQLIDTFYSPPEHYVYGPYKSPLVKSNFTGSIVISSNRDEHSRIFARYQDGDPGSDYTLAIDPIYTPLS